MGQFDFLRNTQKELIMEIGILGRMLVVRKVEGCKPAFAKMQTSIDALMRSILARKDIQELYSRAITQYVLSLQTDSHTAASCQLPILGLRTAKLLTFALTILV